MTTKPTPAPWHYETTPQGNVTIFATRNGDDDKIILGVAQFGPLEVREANARLICSLVNSELPRMQSVIDDLVSVLKRSEAAIQAAHAQTEAESFDHMKIAELEAKRIDAFREERAAALGIAGADENHPGPPTPSAPHGHTVIA